MSIIKVNTLKHTNDTEALTVASDGKVSLAKPFSPNNNLVEYWLLNKGNNNALNGGVTYTPWALDTRTGVASRNTGMSHDTGVFTFPRTGLYRVSLTTRHKGAVSAIGGSINLSTDSGGNYTTFARSYSSDTSDHDHFSYVSMIFNIANATTYRMSFVHLSNSNSAIVYGNNDASATSVLFEEI